MAENDSDSILYKGEIFTYQTNDSKTKIDLRFEDETVWLMQELYQSSKANIIKHIKHIFEEGELEKKELFGVSEQFKTKEYYK